jgi:hypothetical protein
MATREECERTFGILRRVNRLKRFQILKRDEADSITESIGPNWFWMSDSADHWVTEKE